MRVAMLIQNFHPVIGGAERQALSLSAALVAKGHRVDVITMGFPGTPRRETIRGVTVRRLPSHGAGLPRTAVFAVTSAIYLLFASFRYDLFHVHLASSHSIFPALLARLFRKPVMIKLGGGLGIGELALSRHSIVGRIKLALLALLKPTFIVVNEDQREELRTSGLSNSPVAFIPNGVDLSIFYRAESADKQRLREEMGMNGLVFLFVGRFAADKLRPDIFERLIATWAGVRKTAGDISLYFVGEGPLVFDYRRLIARYGVESSVHIPGVALRVTGYLQAADVFLLPSITEGLSNALLEALACGLPVCGSRVPGIVDVVKDGEHGVLFDPMSPTDIERAILSIVNDRQKLLGMSERCLVASAKYSLDETTRKTIDLYQKELA